MTRKKRVGYIMMVLAVCLSLCSCGKTSQNEEYNEVTYQIYYLNKEETKVIPEEYTTIDGSTEDKIAELLVQLSISPKKIGEKSPIGGIVKIKSHSYNNFMLTIDFEDSYYLLEPITEVLTRAAIVRTLTQIEDVNYVIFHVNGQILTYDNEKPVGTMTANTFVENAGAEINAIETVKLVLFFASETKDKLVPIIRTVDYSSNISLEKLVVEQLIQGPAMAEAYPVISSDTKVSSVITRDGICYVNFDSSFLSQSYSVSPEVVIYSITNSLVELPNINKVQILVDGETDKTFQDSFELRNLYERNLNLVE